MLSSQNKIITRLRDRRQIEADLHRMLTATSDLEYRHQAQHVATSGSQVLPVIVASLDRADSRLLDALGSVAALLDRAEVANVLLGAMRSPQLRAQGRVGAVRILERLGLPVPDDLRPGLADAERSVLSSLQALLAQAPGSPAGLIDYVQQLDRQEPDVVLAVIHALDDVRTGQAAELLRMMAQDVREEIAIAAVQALGRWRQPQAVRVLQTLVPTCAPTLRPVAERLLRKLQLVGVETSALPPAAQEWRALVSPVGGLGQQSVWFVQGSREGTHARFLNVLLTVSAGAVEAAGHASVPTRLLPARRSLGAVHDVSVPDGSGGTLMLEGHFDLGRRLVSEALGRNRETQIPVAPALRLLGPWLWGYAGADSLPSRQLPELSEQDADAASGSDTLLAHPAFATWSAHHELTLVAAEEALRHRGWDRVKWACRLASELVAEPEVIQALHRSLVAMSEWLLLAGDAPRSRLALATALAIKEHRQQPIGLLQALVLRDLEQALHSLTEMSAPADTTAR